MAAHHFGLFQLINAFSFFKPSKCLSLHRKLTFIGGGGAQRGGSQVNLKNTKIKFFPQRVLSQLFKEYACMLNVLIPQFVQMEFSGDTLPILQSPLIFAVIN